MMQIVIKWALRGVLAFVVGVVFTVAARADQRIEVPQNGTVRFALSEGGLTRVSVVGDRIARVVTQDETEALQIASDEETGDLYLRLAEGSVDRISGSLVLTSGITLKFHATPRKVDAQTVLVTVTEQKTEHGPREVVVRESRGTGHVSELIVHMRAAIVDGIGSAEVPELPSNVVVRLVETMGVGSYEADVFAVNGGGDGRTLSRESLRRPGALAIWVEKEALRPGETAWAIVLRHPNGEAN